MDATYLLKTIGADFYTGVPDSQLQPFCDCLMDFYGIDPRHHIIAANEGNSVALAAGYHLATGKIPVVYMQNSGEGNIINPVVSLLNESVYAIPIHFIIGWRGEPGVSDEPQHIYQGKITLRLLEDMGISSFVVGKATKKEEVFVALSNFREFWAKGKSTAFVVQKGALSYDKIITYTNTNRMNREEALQHIIRVTGEDPVISTTGKISRELFEIRETNCQGHEYDFLTVGSMGHSTSIALGIALHMTDKKVWSVDGDGAALMHMGAMAVIGTIAPRNMVHIVLNNESHESVGGMPTAAKKISLAKVAKACGYPYTIMVENLNDLDRELKSAKLRGCLSMIEAKCSIGARSDLGRPTIAAKVNKQHFMSNLLEKKDN